MPGFDHEKLDVYKVAIDFVAASAAILEGLQRGSSHLADQLHRAATSIPLNIAEGAGEFSKREKARFYRIALRSATECAALLDVFQKLGLATESELGTGRSLLHRIVSMLTVMAQKLTATSGTGPGTGAGTG